MKKSVVRSIISVFGVLLMTFPAFAYTVSVNQNNGTTYSTTSLTGYSTNGTMMDGMKVKVYFSDQTSAEALWADTGSGSGAASGTNWSLSESGDTYGGLWSFVNGTGLGITAFTIDAGAGNTVFDRTNGGNWGTDGSAQGWDFSVQSAPTDLAITATYSDLVALTGYAPVGDLFRFLTVEFANGGFASDSQMTYITDTDNLLLSGDLTSVPEPGTILLLGGGLLGLAFYGRKRSKM
ncbi:MAG: PEP-CTERM sorting domain-containing protein [Geobacter sp.]|nr:MAG: PEP-CTERM sorting domain-containing protein [Geobacter sp.]